MKIFRYIILSLCAAADIGLFIFGVMGIGAFAGDPVLAHEGACELVDRMNRIPIPRRYPVVIASAGGYPKDINVYQPLKTLCHMVACAEPGGTMIMLSESREGFGSPDTEEQIRSSEKR